MEDDLKILKVKQLKNEWSDLIHNSSLLNIKSGLSQQPLIGSY
jgi:hypothetical protein